jgi:DEK C terminal domain
MYPQYKDRIVELLNAADLHTLSFKALRSQIEKEFNTSIDKHLFKKYVMNLVPESTSSSRTATAANSPISASPKPDKAKKVLCF